MISFVFSIVTKIYLSLRISLTTCFSPAWPARLAEVPGASGRPGLSVHHSPVCMPTFSNGGLWWDEALHASLTLCAQGGFQGLPMPLLTVRLYPRGWPGAAVRACAGGGGLMRRRACVLS